MADAYALPPLGMPPAPRNRLIGRQGDVAMARAFLLDDAVPLLTLTGPGGVGKTRLALAIAAEVASHFSDGVVFVDLSPLADPEMVAAAVAATLEVASDAHQSITAALIARLRSRQSLLFLDNCEHLLPGVGGVVASLLAGCPALQILATSRASLHVRGEQVLPISPLETPDRAATFQLVRAAPAAALFVQRARAVDPSFALTELNAGAVAEICQRLDGLPLALELAAARSNVLTPAAMAALLSQRLQILGLGARDAPARHQTIQQTIAWSYDLLSPEEQRVFRRLAVFSGGWTLEGASAVCGLALPETVAFLDTLVDQSLVVRRTDTVAQIPRFTMLETIREFGLQRLKACGDEEDARDRHAAYFRDLISNLDLFYAFPGDASWLVHIVPEEDNLRQALEQFLARGDARSLSELSSGLSPYWITRSQSLEGLRWLELAIANDQDLPAVLRAQCRDAVGLFLLQHGDIAAAVPILEEAVAMARACHDLALLRHTLQTLGNLARSQGDLSRAMTLHEESEQAARAVAEKSPHGGLYVGAELCFQGLVAHQSGDTTTALKRFAAGIPYLRAPGGSRRLGMMLGELGIIQITIGRLDDAALNLIESVALTWQADYGTALARTLRGLSAVATVTDQVVAGLHLLGAADALYAKTPFAVVRTADDRDIIDWTLTRLARRLDPSLLEQEKRTGSGLEVNEAVALARDVVGTVIGVTRVQEIWHATQAPDPGPLPRASLKYLHLTAMPAAPDSGALLTLREREVLGLLCQRLTDQEIAEQLFISPRTANRHVSNILSKLGATNRRQVAGIAVRAGLLPA